MLVRSCPAAVAAVFSAAPAAAFQVFDDEASFLAAIGPFVVEDFNSVVSDASFRDQPAAFDAFALLSFDDGSFEDDVVDALPFFGTFDRDIDGTPCIRADVDAALGDPLIFDVVAPQSFFGASCRSLGGEPGEGVEIGQDVFPFARSSGFFGVVAAPGEDVAQLRFVGEDFVFGVDDVITGAPAIPLPAAGLLLGTAPLAGGAAARRRVRRP